MIVCPVCEHPQATGAECDVCGKKLLHGTAAIPFVPAVEGFEPTRLADVEAGGETLPDLEPTGQAAADAADDPAPGIDRGREDPVDVDVVPVPDVERTAVEIAGDVATPVPVFVTCRYCRTPSLPGERVCGRCGMRLPVYASGPTEQAVPARRCSCGAAVTGPICPSCGARSA